MRYGGLRCPSEVLSLTWQNVDWEAGRIRVSSPKTEHHPGKDSRLIPMFPELRPILEEAFGAAPLGAVYVVDERYRRSSQGKAGWRNCNLRTTFEKIIRRAGLTPWPRLFHNLRSSCETELAERFPMHVVTAWLGHTLRDCLEALLPTHGGALSEGCPTGGTECGTVLSPYAARRSDGEGFEPPVDSRPQQFSRLPP